MAFLDKAGLQTLTNKLVQGDAIKVASSRGNTVKNVIDNITRECSDVENPQTMTLEDETGHFMIGKGKDIDVSGDVEAGKMAFGFKGRTFKNESFVNFQDASQFNNLGNTELVDGYLVFKKYGLFNNAFSKKFSLKPATKYTLVMDIKENTIVPKNIKVPYGSSLSDASQFMYDFNTVEELGTGVFKKLLTTHSDLSQTTMGLRLYMSDKATGGVLKFRYYLLEGDWTDKEVPPFFTGIKSSFETEEDRKVVHTGKNLWEWGEEKLARFDICSVSKPAPILKANTYYTISIGNVRKATSDGEYPHLRLSAAGTNDVQLANYSLRPNTSFSFKLGGDVKMLIVYSNGFNWSGSKGKFASIENFQIEEGRGATEYAPYIKEEKVLELDEPLRSLPNGVCDEITEDGRLIRRINKIELTPALNWRQYDEIYIDAENMCGFFCYFDNSVLKKEAGNSNPLGAICQQYPIADRNNLKRTSYNSITRSRDYLTVVVRKAELTSHDIPGFTKWLQEKSISVWVEKKATSEGIKEVGFNISQHNKIDISSTVAPITTYKVPLNRAAQIDNSIKTIQELKQRIELLEQAYDNHFLESQYKLSLLKLEHQIESEEI